MMRNQVADLAVRDAVLRFVMKRNFPRWYAGEILVAEQRGLSDEEVVALYSSGVAAATLEYRQWEGAM